MLRVFAIRDDKAEAYMQPFCCQTRGQAVRMFADSVNGLDGQQGSVFSKHPEDFGLFELGVYDEDRGVLSSFPEGPQLVGKGQDYNVNVPRGVN